MRVVYVDTLFVINAGADLLCLLAAERVCDLHPRKWRLWLGAILGGLYAVLGVLPGLAFLKSPILFPVAAMAMTLATFGRGPVIRPWLVVMAAGAMLGGAVYGVSLVTGAALFSTPGTLGVFLLALGLSYSAFTLVFRRLLRGKRRGGLLRITARRDGRNADFTALRDTGNSLRDPITGCRVLVCGESAFLPLLSGEERRCWQLARGDAVRFLELTGKGFRLIPYRAMGTPEGLLAAFRPDKLICEEKEVSDPLIALSPVPVSDGGAYTALAGAEDG